MCGWLLADKPPLDALKGNKIEGFPHWKVQSAVVHSAQQQWSGCANGAISSAGKPGKPAYQEAGCIEREVCVWWWGGKRRLECVRVILCGVQSYTTSQFVCLLRLQRHSWVVLDACHSDCGCMRLHACDHVRAAPKNISFVSIKHLCLSETGWSQYYNNKRSYFLSRNPIERRWHNTLMLLQYHSNEC